MRYAFRLSALLVMLMVAASLATGAPASAQETGEPFELEDLEGLQLAVDRTYTVDLSGMLDAVSTPGADLEDLETPTGLFSLTGMILEFDEAENAEAGFAKINEGISAAMESGQQDAEEIDLDVGDQSRSFTTTEDLSGQTMDAVVTIIQQDNYMYFVYGSGTEVDVQSIVRDFANTLIENDGSGEGEFHEDGTSSGGLWDKFPAADDELIAGLAPSDSIVFPEPASTPEA